MTIRAGLPYQLFDLNGRYREEHRAPAGQDRPVGGAKCLPQSSRLRLALDAGRDYNIVIVFAEGA
jgi:hypothetical protein